MYLKDGREIYESEKYPGYYIEANSGNYCDQYGNLVGGNEDMGDDPRAVKAFREKFFAEALNKNFRKSKTKKKR